MTVNLSLFAGAGAQFFDNNGLPLTGGLLYSYAAGTTTQAATYTSNSGSIANSNPIVLDSAGRVPNEIWLTQGSTYKFVLQTSAAVQIGSWDNIPGANDQTAFNTFVANLASSTGSSLVGYNQGGTGAVTTTVQAKLRQIVSVKDFGATGDGTTDDTAAIQAAINANKSVFFPSGTYVVSNLNLTSNTYLFGAGSTSIIKAKSGTTGYIISSNGSYNEIRIDNLYIDGNGIGVTGLFFESAQNIYIRWVTAVNCINALELEAVNALSVFECEFTNNTGFGIDSHRSTDAYLNNWLYITNSLINGNTLGGISVIDTASVVLLDNRILNNKDFGVQNSVSSAKIGVQRSTYFSAIGNDIDSNWNASIKLYNQYEFEVTGNWISGGRTSTNSSTNSAGQGIVLNSCLYGTLEGNQIYACGAQGIYTTSNTNNVSIIGNTIVGCGTGAGILCDSGSNMILIGNQIVPSGGSGFTQSQGINITSGNYHLVTGNNSQGHTSGDLSVAGSNSIYNGNITTSTSQVFNTYNGFYFAQSGVNFLQGNNGSFTPSIDNVMYLGLASNRWKEIWAANGTIQTSDANQKQQFEPLTNAEQNTAKAIKSLIKTFKFNEAVAKKGANARLHIGVSAQEVQAAFTANGLDANKYGLFCSDTWYTLNGEIVPVGTVGATQVTQLGIRYEELLAFVIAAM